MSTTDQDAISPQLISVAATPDICCGGTLCTLSTISWLWEVFSPALPGEDSEESPSSESMFPLSDRPYPLWKDTSPPPARGSSGNTLLQGLQRNKSKIFPIEWLQIPSQKWLPWLVLQLLGASGHTVPAATLLCQRSQPAAPGKESTPLVR